MSSPGQTNKTILTCVFLLVFVALSQIVVSIVSTDDGNFTKYITAAKLFSESRLDPERVTDFSPFYFDLNITLFRWFGTPENWLRLLQVAAAGFSVIAFFLITNRYFSYRVALLGALTFSLSSGFIVLAQIFVPDVWFLTFLLCGIWFLVKSHHERAVWVLLSAAFFGLDVVHEANRSPLYSFCVSCYFSESIKNSVVKTCSFLFVFLTFLVLLLIRNHHYSGQTTLLVMDPGGVFFEGNNPYSDGNGVNTPLVKDLEGQYLRQPSYAQVLLKRIPSAVSGRKMDSDESNRLLAGVKP